MSQDAIGTARIDIVVDTDALNAEVARAKNIVSTLGPEAEKSFAKMSAAEKKATVDALKFGQQVGKTKEEIKLLTLAARGAAPEAIDKMRLALLATRTEAAKGAVAFNAYGVSAKQTAAAMRGVPAQLTDIFVSLQGGQNPMTVLFQQGGQLKDMFGGIVPAAKALSTSLLGMINPVTVLAAAAAGLAVAWYKGGQEMQEYNKVIALTGNFAGMTADQFAGLAQQMDGMAGVTTRSASAALAKVGATGEFTATQIALVGKAAGQMRATTGKEVSATVAEFLKLKADPVTAILELNKTQHFLTQGTLEHIVALKEQGNELGAAQLAMDTYGQHIDGVTAKLEENLGWLQRLGRGLKQFGAEFVDTALSIGREATAADLGNRIKQWQMDIDNLPANDIAMRAARQKQIQDAQRQLVGMGMDASTAANGAIGTVDSPAALKAIEDKKKAGDEWSRWQDQNLSKRQKQQAEEAKIIATGKALGKSEAEVNALLAASRKQFAEAEARSAPKGSRTNPANAIIDRLQKQISLTDAQGQADEKLSTAQKLRLDIEVELARLGAKVSSADKATIADLIKKAEASEAVALAKVQEKKAAEDLARLQAQYSQDEQNQRRANEIDLMGIGRGGNAAEMLKRQLDIQRELADGLDKIRRDAAGKTQAALLQEEAALRASIDRRLGEERTYQDKRIALMGDWRNGAVKAMEDFNAHASDVAGRTGDLFASNFQRAEDAIVQFATTGKLSIKGLLADIGTELVRFFAKQAVMQFIQAFASSWMSGTTGVGANASSAQSGGSFVGPRAKGGAFQGATEFFAKGGAFTNSIVNQATPFAFANGGKFGVMGEAGPEAIMPLERDSRGRLGVIASGGGSGGMSFQQHITINSDGSSKSETSASEQNAAAKEFGNRMRAVAQEEIMRAMRDGGALRRAGVGA